MSASLLGLGLDTEPLLSQVLPQQPSLADIEAAEQKCLAKVSVSEPEWALAAGQLRLWALQQRRPYDDFCAYIRLQRRLGIYDSLYDTYSDAELREAGSWVDPKRDFLYPLSAARLFERRYLGPDERVQWVYLAIALALASAEADRLGWAKRFYDELSLLRISLATPILSGLRRRGANLSSCFIVAAEDSLDSLINVWAEVARISRAGGGVGVNLSRIRANGSWVGGVPNVAGGVTGWIRILNDIAVAVNQGGKRAGAVTVSLDMWHLDIPEFLELQTENGDQRRKAYDIFPQVVIPDLFMERVCANQHWTLVDPYEVRQELGFELAELWGEAFEKAYGEVEAAAAKGRLRLVQTWSARELYLRVLRTLVETGMPYQAFKDTINAANPNAHDGYIPGVNLCVESFSNVQPHTLVHVCNLMSLNLARAQEQTLETSTRLAIRMLDNAIELTEPPIPGAKNHNQRYRTVGLGIMGLADWLARRHLPYTQVAEAEALMERIAYTAFQENISLGLERGSYPAWAGSPLSKGIVFGRVFVGRRSLALADIQKRLGQEAAQRAVADRRYRLELIEAAEQHQLSVVEGRLDWDGIVAGLGRAARCSQLLAIAPNSSTSLLQGCTASYLPVYARLFMDQNGKGAVPIVPPYLQQAFWYYVENKTLDQNIVVNMTAALQRWVDTGISMELLFNLNIEQYRDVRYILRTFVSAWRQKVKAIYYVRWIQRDQTRSEFSECSVCAN